MKKLTKKEDSQELWADLREWREYRKETERLFQKSKLEFDRRMKETDRRMKETDRRMKETDRRMKETDRQMKKTDRQMKKTDLRIDKLSRSLDKTNGNFNDKWGKFVENLVAGDLVNLLSEWGINVNRIQPRLVYPQSRHHRGGEFDLVAINGKELVIVEVKSSLEKKDVDFFVKKLKIFKEVPTEYRDRKIYGGVAYIKCIKKADEYADSEGLFVIKAPGGTSKISTITNHPEKFKPKIF